MQEAIEITETENGSYGLACVDVLKVALTGLRLLQTKLVLRYLDIDWYRAMNDLISPENSEINNPPLATAKLFEAASAGGMLEYQQDDFFYGAAPDGRLLGSVPLDDTHTIVSGGSRADKGTYASNTLLNRRSSLYFSSTKAVDVNKISPRRGHGDQYCTGMGQACYCWNPHGIVECDAVDEVAINPIGGKGGHIDPSRSDWASRAMRLAICIVPLHAGEGEDYFLEDCRSLLVLIILYVASAPQFEGKRTIGTVYDLILEGEVETWEALKEQGLLPKDKKGNITQTPFDVMWSGMKVSTDCAGVIKKKAAYFCNMSKTGDGGQFLGVVGSVAAKMAFLDDPMMRESLSESTFDMGRLKTDPQGVSFFEIMEASKAKSAMPARRMVYAMFEEQMKTIKEKPATGLSVLIWADEFHSWGYMDSILGNLAELAGYFCKFVFLVQTLSQISDEKNGYGKHGLQVFYAGCLSRVFLDVRDHFTASEIQKMAGEQEILLINRSASLAEAETESETHGNTKQHSMHQSDTDGTHRSTNRQTSENTGGQKAHNYNGSIFSPVTPLMLKKLWTTNLGLNWGRSLSDGTSDGSNNSHTQGTADSEGTSDSETQSKTRTKTETRSEQRQSRPLLPIDVIMNRYSKVSTDGVRRALVQICGLGFMEVIRVRHWEHEEFWGKYSKDPDHPFVEAPKPQHIIEQQKQLAYEQEQNSPAGRARAEETLRLNHRELTELQEKEDYSLMAAGLQWVSAAAGVVFLTLGAPVLTTGAAAGFFALRSWKQSIADRKSRISVLKNRLGKSEYANT